MYVKQSEVQQFLKDNAPKGSKALFFSFAMLPDGNYQLTHHGSGGKVLNREKLPVLQVRAMIRYIKKLPEETAVAWLPNTREWMFTSPY